METKSRSLHAYEKVVTYVHNNNLRRITKNDTDPKKVAKSKHENCETLKVLQNDHFLFARFYVSIWKQRKLRQ